MDQEHLIEKDNVLSTLLDTLQQVLDHLKNLEELLQEENLEETSDTEDSWE